MNIDKYDEKWFTANNLHGKNGIIVSCTLFPKSPGCLHMA